MSKLTEYARNELDRLMSNNDDGMQSLMNQNILDLIEMLLSGKLNDVPSGRLFYADFGFMQRCPSL